ncbi:MAG TPA: hypothetical protein VJU61_12905 [Polyangiaceae bacterium]|nr:hypothetical protein [Polyangiaceae bacterium]
MQTNVQPAAPAPPSSTSALPDGFVKVEGGATEQISETTSLMVAYSAIWLILMAFALATYRALRSMRAHTERADEAVRQLSHTPR